MFGRRRARDASPDEPVEPLEADEATEPVAAEDADALPDHAAGGGGGRRPPAAGGPWDFADAPDDAVARLDLGGLRVPVLEGMELRVEVDQHSQQVVAATLVERNSAVQISAFAAPKSSGIWTEVREEIASSVRGQGGQLEVADGSFGPELRGRVPQQVPGQGVVMQAARFVGVDGPRWFLRGLFSGPAATDPAQAQHLEDAFRGVVVVRGHDAMPPREPLPLTLPREAVQAAGGQDAPPAAGQSPYSGLDPFERGPEITEVR